MNPNPVELVFVLVTLFALLAVAFAPESDARAARKAHAFAARSGLGLTSAIQTTVSRRLRLERRLTLIGAAFTPLTFMFVTPATDSAPYSGFTFIGLSAVGGATGHALAAILDGRRRDSGSVRLARSTDVRLEDYVAPGFRIAARASAGGAFVLNAAAAWMPGPRVHLAAGLVLTAVSVGALLCLEIGGRGIASRRQIADSSTELAWNDAFRASNLMSIAAVVSIVSCYSATSAAVTVASSLWGDLAGLLVLDAGLVVVTMAAMILMGLPHARTHRYYLDRLWPETAAAGRRSGKSSL